MKKIDAHAHIGDFGSWAGVDGSPEQLIAFMDEYEIEQTVLCAKDHTGNEGVAEAAARYPGRFIPLVYLNPLEGADICREKVETYVDGKGFRGIKMNPLRHAFVADDTAVDPVMEMARSRHLPVFIHSGHPPYSLPWSIALLAERFPEVKTVMIHMGHGHGVYIDAALKMAKRFPNIYLEMSGMPMGVRSVRLMKRSVTTASCSARIIRSTILRWRSRRSLLADWTKPPCRMCSTTTQKSCSANKNSSAPDRRSGALYTVGKLRRVP